MREKSIFTQELERLEGPGSDLPLNDFVDYLFYVFSDGKFDENPKSQEGEVADEVPGLFSDNKFWRVISQFMNEIDSERMSEIPDDLSRKNKENLSPFTRDRDFEEESEAKAAAVDCNKPESSDNAIVIQNFIQNRGDITKILYEGNWSSSKESQQDFLFGVSGRFFGLLSFTRSGAKFIFQVFESEFIDSPTLAANFNLEGIPPTENGFFSERKTSVSREEKIFSEKGQIDCQMRVKVSFEHKTTGEKLDLLSNEVSNSKMVGSVQSEDCLLDFIFEGEVSIPDFFKALTFTIFQLIFCGLGIFPLHQMLKEERRNRCLDISDWALMLNIMVDVVIFVINLVFSMRVLIEYFEFLTVVTMFLLFSILFKFRFAIISFNLRFINNSMDARTLSRKKMFFFLKIIGLGILALSVGTLFIEFEFLFFIIFLYPVFQIWHNVVSVDKKNCFSLQVHPLLYLSQILYPICLKGLPNSLFKLAPSPDFALHLISLHFVFLAILLTQRFLGAAFFIPKELVPGYHHYTQKVTPDSKFAGEICPICFTALSCDPVTGKAVANQDFLLTPCKHSFHSSCLKSWMERKLACPTCRNKIPPII